MGRSISPSASERSAALVRSDKSPLTWPSLRPTLPQPLRLVVMVSQRQRCCPQFLAGAAIVGGEEHEPVNGDELARIGAGESGRYVLHEFGAAGARVALPGFHAVLTIAGPEVEFPFYVRQPARI